MRVSATFHFDEIHRRLITHSMCYTEESPPPPFGCDYDEAKAFVENAVDSALADALADFRGAYGDEEELRRLPSYHRREIDKLSTMLDEAAAEIPPPSEEVDPTEARTERSPETSPVRGGTPSSSEELELGQEIADDETPG